MTTCPSTEVLNGLLDGPAGVAAPDGLVQHVETCPACQRRLERLTDPAGLLAGPEPDPATETVPPEAGGPAATSTPPTGEFEVFETITPGGAHGRAGPTTALPPGPGPAGAGGRRALPALPDYEVDRVLGEGGMGVVYLARHRRLNRRVALKMIRDGGLARPDHRARFRIEAEAVARLRHPNVVQIFDFGEADGRPYVALELLEGGDLAARLDGTPWPGREAVAQVVPLARGVAAAHGAGIIHRDLKPANILFTAEGEPKVADFGLAKRQEDDGLTETGHIMGTPEYMAPEQARGSPDAIGPATDVYALGAILYELLTGRPPFKGETPFDTIRQVADAEVVPPSRLVPKVARDLETICLVCLSKDPARRYASARALADDLERYHAGEPIVARRAGPLERAAKWARRRPAAAALVALAVAAAAGLLAAGAAHVREQDRLHRLALRLDAEGDRRIDAAREQAAPDDLDRARRELSEFLAGLGREPRTAPLAGRVRAAIAGVDRKLQEIRTREAARERGRAERQRFEDFGRRRERANLASVEFELDPAGRAARLRQAARAALAVYAADPAAPDRDWALAPALPASLADAERRRIAEGCFDLLLVLSQAVEPAEGLAILDRAERLRPEPGPALHLRRADYLGRLGDAAGRRREEALAAGQAPRTALDHFLVGREHVGRRRWDEAIPALETALALDPELGSARVLLAQAQSQVRPPRLSEALGNLNAALRDQPELVELYLLRALVHAARGVEALRAAAPPRAVAGAAFAAAEADYRAALGRELSAALRYVVLVNRGGMCLQAGRYAESARDLEAAIRLDPAPFQAHATLAQLHQLAGRTAEAAAAFGAALERVADPATRAELRRSRARLHAGDPAATPERRAQALADLAAAIREDPADATMVADDHAVCAQLHLAEGRHVEALAACDAALGRAPAHPLAVRLRLSALLALRRYDAVLAAGDAHLRSHAPTPEVLELRGLARVARRDHAGAIADYTHALELRPAPEPALRTRLRNGRGWCYHFADAPRLALADFEAALRLDPEQSDALAGRGLAHVRLGAWRPAVADADAALRHAAPGALARARFNAARIYAQAVEPVAAEGAVRGAERVPLYLSYRDRALELLRLALVDTPEAERAGLLEDPALRPLDLPRPRPSPSPTIAPAF
jgi:tetratricopeptide (TPR) repeat protein